MVLREGKEEYMMIYKIYHGMCVCVNIIKYKKKIKLNKTKKYIYF